MSVALDSHLCVRRLSNFWSVSGLNKDWFQILFYSSRKDDFWTRLLFTWWPRTHRAHLELHLLSLSLSGSCPLTCSIRVPAFATAAGHQIQLHIWTLRLLKLSHRQTRSAGVLLFVRIFSLKKSNVKNWRYRREWVTPTSDEKIRSMFLIFDFKYIWLVKNILVN